MPANLTPDYERADRRYREAATDEERLEALREMYSTIPKHKGTEKLQADLKRRISQFRKAVAKKPAKGTDPFHIPRAGAGQVALVGPPNVGKSLIVVRTTHAVTKVADYPFTTALPLPGMCHSQDVQIELVDTPPIAPGHLPGGLIGLVRQCDIVAVVVDLSADPLEEAEMVLGALAERGIELRTIRVNELDPTDHGRQCGMLLGNKLDLADAETAKTLVELYAGRLEVWCVSGMTGAMLDGWIARLWELLALVRVYTKEPGHQADRGRPFALSVGSTVEDLAREIHRELSEKMKFAKLWREGRAGGQQVHRTEELADGDVVEIHE